MPADTPQLINRCPHCDTWNPPLSFAQQLKEVALVAQVKYVAVSCAAVVSKPEEWQIIAGQLPRLKIQFPQWDKIGAAFFEMMKELAAVAKLPQAKVTGITQALLGGVEPPQQPQVCGAILAVHVQEFINFASMGPRQ